MPISPFGTAVTELMSRRWSLSTQRVARNLRSGTSMLPREAPSGTDTRTMKRPPSVLRSTAIREPSGERATSSIDGSRPKTSRFGSLSPGTDGDDGRAPHAPMQISRQVRSALFADRRRMARGVPATARCRFSELARRVVGNEYPMATDEFATDTVARGQTAIGDFPYGQRPDSPAPPRLRGRGFRGLPRGSGEIRRQRSRCAQIARLEAVF